MIFSKINLAIGMVAGFLLAWIFFVLLNQTFWLPNAIEKGREQERSASLERAMELIEQRSRTNAEIRNLDDRGLCLALGGSVYEDGECH